MPACLSPITTKPRATFLTKAEMADMLATLRGDIKKDIDAAIDKALKKEVKVEVGNQIDLAIEDRIKPSVHNIIVHQTTKLSEQIEVASNSYEQCEAAFKSQKALVDTHDDAIRNIPNIIRAHTKHQDDVVSNIPTLIKAEVENTVFGAVNIRAIVQEEITAALKTRKMV